MAATKLYLPYGTFDPGTDRRRLRRSVHGGAVFHWFVVGRTEPIAPYPSLILGHKTLVDNVRIAAERTVDEFFAETEFHLFRDYLQSCYGQDIRTAVLSPPVTAIRPDAYSHIGALRPFYPYATESIPGAIAPEPEDDALDTDEPEIASALEAPITAVQRTDRENGLYRLAEEEGYPLPFAVWGFAAPLERPGRFARLSPAPAVTTADPSATA